jgi:glycosyltransferase involved in cell wall biosynthesis
VTPVDNARDGKLTVVSSYGAGGSSARVRLFDWMNYLEMPFEQSDYLGKSDNALSTILKDLPSVAVAERRLRRLAKSGDLSRVLLGREASPFSNGVVEASLLEAADRGIYDFDDALFAYPTGGVRRIWSKRSVWERSVVAADVVIAGNDYLGETASKFSANVVMIPSCVDPDGYAQKDDFEVSETPRAMWIGSPSTEQYLSLIETPLLRLHRERGLRLTVISAGEQSLGALDTMVDRVNWSAESFGSELARADVGIMPLPDSDFARGKCAYKLLQYGAAGLPSAASPVGANALALARSGGLPASSDDEWFEAVESLIDASTDARTELGSQARRAIREHYSFQAWAPTFRDAIGATTAL